MEQPPEKSNSVEFSINSSGKWQGKCKCYDLTLGLAYQNALKVAEKMEKKLRIKNERKE